METNKRSEKTSFLKKISGEAGFSIFYLYSQKILRVPSIKIERIDNSVRPVYFHPGLDIAILDRMSKISVPNQLHFLLTLFLSIFLTSVSAFAAPTSCSLIFSETITTSPSEVDFLSFLKSLPGQEKHLSLKMEGLWRGDGSIFNTPPTVASFIFGDTSFEPRPSSYRILAQKLAAEGVLPKEVIKIAESEIEKSVRDQLSKEGYREFIGDQMRRSVVGLATNERKADVLFASASGPEVAQAYAVNSLDVSLKENPGKNGMAVIYEIDHQKVTHIFNTWNGEGLIFNKIPINSIKGLFVGTKYQAGGETLRWFYLKIISKNDPGVPTRVEVIDVDGRYVSRFYRTIGSFNNALELQRFLESMLPQ